MIGPDETGARFMHTVSDDELGQWLKETYGKSLPEEVMKANRVGFECDGKGYLGSIQWHQDVNWPHKWRGLKASSLLTCHGCPRCEGSA